MSEIMAKGITAVTSRKLNLHVMGMSPQSRNETAGNCGELKIQVDRDNQFMSH
jgi:hypothetical protein